MYTAQSYQRDTEKTQRSHCQNYDTSFGSVTTKPSHCHNNFHKTIKRNLLHNIGHSTLILIHILPYFSGSFVGIYFV